MLLFFLLACTRQEPQMPQSKRVDVKLEPDVPGDIEISISELQEVLPASKDWDEAKKKRVWSLFHLIGSPCPFEEGSLLSSLKVGTCDASLILKKRAIRNLNLDDEALIDLITVPDSWFSDAQQGQDTVTVELWIDVPVLAEERLLSQLKELHDAQLRICSRSNGLEKVQGNSLPVGQEVSDIEVLFNKNVKKGGTCSPSLSEKVRSSPTWFVEGFRLRGFQSIRSIQRLISLSKQDTK